MRYHEQLVGAQRFGYSRECTPCSFGCPVRAVATQRHVLVHLFALARRLRHVSGWGSSSAKFKILAFATCARVTCSRCSVEHLWL